MDIDENHCLPNGIDRLVSESKQEGFRFLNRLVADYHSGENRFNKPGEALLSVSLTAGLIAIAGLNIDPYSNPGIGRVRRVYVSKSARGQGIGAALIRQIESKALASFSELRLFTDNKDADIFYCKLGYNHLDNAHSSHVKNLKP